jgi:hypothetical protein
MTDRPEITFPVQQGKNVSGFKAKRGTCPACGEVMNAEPGTFAYMSGGALRRTGKDTAVMAADLSGFLSLGLHGAHGPGENSPSGALRIADDTTNGQFEYYFCSTSCLRGFLNLCVDELERAVRPSEA